MARIVTRTGLADAGIVTPTPRYPLNSAFWWRIHAIGGFKMNGVRR